MCDARKKPREVQLKEKLNILLEEFFKDNPEKLQVCTAEIPFKSDEYHFCVKVGSRLLGHYHAQRRIQE